jgi:hypothetical protein
MGKVGERFWGAVIVLGMIALFVWVITMSAGHAGS